MSSLTLDYPNRIHSQRNVDPRWITILAVGLVLVASVVLVAASTSIKVDSPASVIAILVPVAPAGTTQAQPAVTATPAPNPVVIAVPVATPPSP